MKKIFKPIIKLIKLFEMFIMFLYKRLFFYRIFEREMPSVIKKYKNITTENKKIINHCIWVFWYQKLENSPEVVQMCVKSIKRNANGNKVVVLNKDNIKDYVEIPEYIYKSFMKE